MQTIYEYCAECGKKLPLDENKNITLKVCPGCNCEIQWVSTLSGLACYKKSRDSKYEEILDSFIVNTLEQALDSIRDRAECDEKESLELDKEITNLKNEWSELKNKISILSANEDLFKKEIEKFKKKLDETERLIERSKEDRKVLIRRSTHLRKQLKRINISLSDNK